MSDEVPTHEVQVARVADPCCDLSQRNGEPVAIGEVDAATKLPAAGCAPNQPWAHLHPPCGLSMTVVLP